MTTIPTPPVPAAAPPPGYSYVKAGRGFNVAALTVGAIGAVIGLGPFIFGVFAAAFGVAAIVLGFVAYRAARAAHGHSGRVAIGLGTVALTLGIVGMVTVNDAVNDLEDDLEQIGPADPDEYTPPTEAEINSADIMELYTMYGEAPIGSDAEARIEAELTERGEFG